MEAKLKNFGMLLLFCLCNRGDAVCSLSDIFVNQTTTPGQIGEFLEFHVMVENKCICTQTDVKLACPGFNSLICIDLDIIKQDSDGKLCTLNSGGPVKNEEVISFYYSWNTQFSFTPISSSIACS